MVFSFKKTVTAQISLLCVRQVEGGRRPVAEATDQRIARNHAGHCLLYAGNGNALKISILNFYHFPLFLVDGLGYLAISASALSISSFGSE